MTSTESTPEPQEIQAGGSPHQSPDRPPGGHQLDATTPTSPDGRLVILVAKDDDGWTVEIEGADRRQTFSTKAEALHRARALAHGYPRAP